MQRTFASFLLLVCVLASGIGCNSNASSDADSSPTQPSQCRNVTTQVFADRFWQDTGIAIQAGNTVRIAASGTWSDSAGATDANGRGSQPVTGPSDIVPISGLPIMRLIGRVGTRGAPFQVGGLTAFTSNATGSLFLTPNDRSDTLWDNFGSLTAFVTVCP